MEAHLDVRWILVGFLHGHLQFLSDPDFQFIHITWELLHGLGLSEFGAVLKESFFKITPSRIQKYPALKLWMKSDMKTRDI